MAALGFSIPFFFRYIKFCVLALFFIFVVYCCYDMSIFVKENHCRFISGEPKKQECGSLWKFYLSQGNSDPNAQNDVFERVLFVLSFIGVVLMRIFYQFRFIQLDKQLDDQNIDITDYTIEVNNLPLDAQEYHIKAFFREILRKNNLSDEFVEVVSINFVYQDYGIAVEKGNKLKQTLDEYKRNLKGNVPDTEEYFEMIESFNVKLTELDEELENNFEMINIGKRQDRRKFTGTAFVVVEKEDHAILIKNHFSIKEFPKLILTLFGTIPNFILNLMPAKQKHLYDEEIPSKGYIFIDRPKPPEDLIWENLGKTKLNRFYRKLISLGGTILIFGLTLAVLVSLKIWQKNSGPNFWISIAFTLVIKGINELASFLNKKLIDLERINSRTMLSTELTWRSSIVRPDLSRCRF